MTVTVVVSRNQGVDEVVELELDDEAVVVGDVDAGVVTGTVVVVVVVVEVLLVVVVVVALTMR
jgi:hypothetical protein